MVTAGETGLTPVDKITEILLQLQQLLTTATTTIWLGNTYVRMLDS